jgi:hypothetical protein
MGYSPINLPILSKLLSVYPDRETADILYNGFRYGFRINYAGPRVHYESRNCTDVIYKYTHIHIYISLNVIIM